MNAGRSLATPRLLWGPCGLCGKTGIGGLRLHGHRICDECERRLLSDKPGELRYAGSLFRLARLRRNPAEAKRPDTGWLYLN